MKVRKPFWKDDKYRTSWTDIGGLRTRSFSITNFLEDHSHIGTTVGRNCVEKSWTLKLSEEGVQGPMNQRPDLDETKREWKRLHDEHVKKDFRRKTTKKPPIRRSWRIWFWSRSSNKIEVLLSFESQWTFATSNIFVLVNPMGTARRLEQTLEFLANFILDWLWFFCCSKKICSWKWEFFGNRRNVWKKTPVPRHNFAQSLHNTNDMCFLFKFELHLRNWSPNSSARSLLSTFVVPTSFCTNLLSTDPLICEDPRQEEFSAEFYSITRSYWTGWRVAATILRDTTSEFSRLNMRRCWWRSTGEMSRTCGFVVVKCNVNRKLNTKFSHVRGFCWMLSILPTGSNLSASPDVCPNVRQWTLPPSLSLSLSLRQLQSQCLFSKFTPRSIQDSRKLLVKFSGQIDKFLLDLVLNRVIFNHWDGACQNWKWTRKECCWHREYYVFQISQSNGRKRTQKIQINFFMEIWAAQYNLGGDRLAWEDWNIKLGIDVVIWQSSVRFHSRTMSNQVDVTVVFFDSVLTNKLSFYSWFQLIEISSSPQTFPRQKKNCVCSCAHSKNQVVGCSQSGIAWTRVSNSKSRFTTLVSEDFHTIKRSWKFEERCESQWFRNVQDFISIENTPRGTSG